MMTQSQMREEGERSCIGFGKGLSSKRGERELLVGRKGQEGKCINHRDLYIYKVEMEVWSCSGDFFFI